MTLRAAELLADESAYAEWFAGFVSASPSSYHAAVQLSRLFGAAGFAEYREESGWQVQPGSAGFVRRDGALIAWRVGAATGPADEAAPGAAGSATVSAPGTSGHPIFPARIYGCHTDSPAFKLKPEPDFSAAGVRQVGVEVYGGPLINSWLDRDLRLAGRLVLRDDSEVLSCTGPVARIPQLAIHLDREVNDSLRLERQAHLQPILGLEAVGEQSVLELLARAATSAAADEAAPAPGPVAAEHIAGFDVFTVDAQPPARIGASGELLASSRLDNLSSVGAGAVALLAATPAPGEIALFAGFDHEELGSETRSGACGPFLADVLGRLWAALGADSEQQARALALSTCVSADSGHAVHPNYQQKHDPHVRPLLGGGPMLKVNANQRYASDAHGAALWQRLCEAAGVQQQVFVSNNDSPCGTTIGPLTATRLGVRTVDVGVPLLSMHSARELAAVRDLHGLARVAERFFAGK